MFKFKKQIQQLVKQKFIELVLREKGGKWPEHVMRMLCRGEL